MHQVASKAFAFKFISSLLVATNKLRNCQILSLSLSGGTRFAGKLFALVARSERQDAEALYMHYSLEFILQIIIIFELELDFDFDFASEFTASVLRVHKSSFDFVVHQTESFQF